MKLLFLVFINITKSNLSNFVVVVVLSNSPDIFRMFWFSQHLLYKNESEKCWCSCDVVTWGLCQHGRQCDRTERERPGCSTDLVMSPNIIQQRHTRRREGECLWEAPCRGPCSAMCDWRRTVTLGLHYVTFQRLNLNLSSGGSAVLLKQKVVYSISILF